MRRVAMVLLAVGAVGGFWSAFHHRHWQARHEAFERHVADICADSALRAHTKAGEKQ